MITTKRKVYFQRDRSNRRVIAPIPPASRTVPAGRIPRVSKLMALAIHFDRLIREGKVANQSELARLCSITQPRATQIMNLLHLAPDIIDAVLHLPMTEVGRDSIHERSLRSITAEADWSIQRRCWVALLAAKRPPDHKNALETAN